MKSDFDQFPYAIYTWITLVMIFGLLTGIWLGATAMASKVRQSCEQRGSWSHTSKAFDPETLTIECRRLWESK